MRAKNHRIGRYGLVVAAALALATAGRARGDFVLTGTQHLDVVTSHTTGVLYDSSTAAVRSSGSILYAYVNQQARLWIVEDWARVGSLYAYDSSAVGISQGFADYLFAYDSSAVDISGGTMGQVYACGSSTVRIGQHVGGGSTDWVVACDSSAVNISGGSVGSLQANNSSTVGVSGGSISSLYAYSTSEITLDGYDFHAWGGLILDGGRVLGTGVLTGKWFDGTSWATTILANDPTATILAIPEPATLGLLGLGMAGALLRRRGAI